MLLAAHDSMLELQMNTPDVPCGTQALSLEEYARELAMSGVPVVLGPIGSLWVRYESLAMMRVPTFVTAAPSADEIHHVFSQARRPIITYVRKPDVSHLTNGCLYLIQAQAYSSDNLSKGVRYDIRRGLSELDIRWIGIGELLTHGFQAFCDTRTRVGLTDGAIHEFTRRFTKWARCSGHLILSAWRGDKLAAFLSIIDVDDWAEIEGGFSRTDCLKFRPNEALVHSALDWYLSRHGRRRISYGLSSIQPGHDHDGLHHFKTKFGFTAVPVHRAFVMHNLLRPIANRATLRGINMLVRWKPGERRLRKAAGLLATLVPPSSR